MVAIAAVAAVAVVTTRGDDGGGSTGWNGIVGLDERGRLVVLDRDGEQVDRFSTGHGAADTSIVHTLGSSVVLHDEEEAVVVVVDVRSGDQTELDVPEDATVSPVVGTDRLLFATPASGGPDAVLIDVADASAIDVTDGVDLDDEPLLLPFAARTVADGSLVAVLDSRSFSTIAISLGDDRDPVVLPGAAVGMTSDGIVTAESDDGAVRVRSFDRDGEERSEVTVDQARRWVPLTDAVLWFDDDGALTRTAADGGDPQDLGSVDIEGDLGLTVPVADGRRAVLVGDGEVVLLDGQGDEVGRVSGLASIRPQRFTLASRCVSFGEDEITTIDTDAAAVVSTTEGSFVTATSLDGCTLAVEGPDGPRVVHDGEVVDVGEGSAVAMAPDGSAAIVRDHAEARLVTLDQPDAPAVELVESLRYAFVQR